MKFKSAHSLLIATLLLGAAPVFADSTVTSPDGTTATVPDAGVALEPGSTVVVDPGSAVVVTEFAPVNVGLEGVVAWGTTAKGPAWVDAKGMALYNSDADQGGESACDATCAATWVPLSAEGTAKGVDEWTIVNRADGTKQWAFRTHPLYTYALDKAPGEVSGDGIGGFHLAD